MPKRKNGRNKKSQVSSTEILRKKRHYFFLNPYEDCAFTRCPKCTSKTMIRKFPLVIHIEPKQLLCQNKHCRYCTRCDLIIAKKSEVESLMAAKFETANPSVIGNEYLVFGTLDKKDWRQYSKVPEDPGEVIEQVHVFKDVWNFELVYGGWGRDG